MNTQESVRKLIAENPEKLPAEIAAELNISELEAVSNLPESMVTLLDGSLFETLTEAFRTWGEVLTVLDVEVIFLNLLAYFLKAAKSSVTTT